MSDTTAIIARDETNGRFLPGNIGGGRKPGSRNKLGEQFVADLRDAWNEHGAVALRRAADEDPVGFCRIVAGLLPRDVNLSATVDVQVFADRFQAALELLGNEAEPVKPRRPLRVINAR